MTGARLERAYFEGLYADRSDPWGFETSPYEAAKYRRTLAALDGRRFSRALEVGCSIGVFTAMLSPRCAELLAVDVSALAVATARERLAGIPGVRVERRTLPEETPHGPFDLIVCSEVLYYFGRELLSEVLERFRAALSPGGSLLAVHWRPRTRTYPLQGDEVHEILSLEMGFPRRLSVVEPLYRLDRFDLPASAG